MVKLPQPSSDCGEGKNYDKQTVTPMIPLLVVGGRETWGDQANP